VQVIAPGTKIGVYEIDREVGRGGMGVVYLARDTKLDRNVAIKALPEHMADDPERLARFEREAKTLAQLNHPNVAQIFGIEEHEGRRFLVLEYVEGDTLAERLDAGPMPIDDALEMCAEIAAGVGAAHDAGVVHRDLKPANIKFDADGKAKVLDFGLAKASEGHSSSSMDVTDAATMSQATRPGAILGTAPYMSPEQARGRTLDKRTDIWSFGVVMYESLTGVCPFSGETMTDSLGAILHRDMNWDLLPSDTPAVVRLLLRRCLQRERKRRLQDINDARVEIEEAIHDPSMTTLNFAGQALAEVSARGKKRQISVGIAALLFLAIGLAAGWFFKPAEDIGTLHLAVPMPWNDDFSANAMEFDISPDGRMLAFLAHTPSSTPERQVNAIFIRSIDEPESRMLAGTEHSRTMRFSPDGRHMLYAYYDPDTDLEQLRRLSVDGGPTLTIIDDRDGNTYAMHDSNWISDDEVLLMGAQGEFLSRVPASGGAVTKIGDVPTDDEWDFAGDPQPVPGADAILYTRLDFGTSGVRTSVFAMDTRTGQSHMVIEDGANPKLTADGHLIFVRISTLFAAPFDKDTLSLTGPVVPLLTGLYSWENFPSNSFAISEAGHLAYIVGASNDGQRRLVTMNKRGEVEQLVDAERHYAGAIVLSPEGDRLAVVIMRHDGPPQVNVLQIATGFLRPISNDTAPSFAPRWTPDGRIVFTEWIGPKRAELVLVDPNLSSRGEKLIQSDPNAEVAQYAPTFTPDGRFMVFQIGETDDGLPEGLYLAPLEIGAEPTPLLTTGHADQCEISPDGKWMAYTTDASGRYQVVLRSFDVEAGVGRRVYPVSFDGGTEVFWSRDGSTLYFRSAEHGDLMSAAIETDPALKISPPEKVLEGDLMHSAGWGEHGVDLMPDGERFIFVQEPEGSATPTHINFILNWDDVLDEHN